ncbi:hypothetical protein ANANG_G00216350 [Anguilla anguilla]|uniref:Uncharacterized protein n=1 Tax=Anguilla anguilla TaxID=7936 RepID=A0A9D3LZG7_ANGAN|nr:hypothetical protein ANANG_G00216350 [Anguilla anguilla]
MGPTADIYCAVFPQMTSSCIGNKREKKQPAAKMHLVVAHNSGNTLIFFFVTSGVGIDRWPPDKLNDREERIVLHGIPCSMAARAWTCLLLLSPHSEHQQAA